MFEYVLYHYVHVLYYNHNLVLVTTGTERIQIKHVSNITTWYCIRTVLN